MMQAKIVTYKGLTFTVSSDTGEKDQSLEPGPDDPFHEVNVTANGTTYRLSGGDVNSVFTKTVGATRSLQVDLDIPIFLPKPPSGKSWSKPLRLNLVFSETSSPTFTVSQQGGYNPWLDSTDFMRGELGKFASVDGDCKRHQIAIDGLDYEQYVEYFGVDVDKDSIKHRLVVGLFGSDDNLQLIVSTGFDSGNSSGRGRHPGKLIRM